VNRKETYAEWAARRARYLAERRAFYAARRERKAAARELQSANARIRMDRRVRRLKETPYAGDMRRFWRMDPYLAGLLAGFIGCRDVFRRMMPALDLEGSAEAFRCGVSDSEDMRFADVADDLFAMRQADQMGFDRMVVDGMGQIRGPELIAALECHVCRRRNLHADFKALARLLLVDDSGRQSARKVVNHPST
jgi:hypothetical protein